MTPIQADPSTQVIFFDVDDTLYPATSGVWPKIGHNINRFMVERAGFSEEEVSSVREHYFREFGTTLNGLRFRHGVDPKEYLEFVHDIPLTDYLRSDPPLRALLSRLPQSKWIFSNADRPYIERVLQVLGIDDQFLGIIDIYATGFACKPQEDAYLRALELAGSPAVENCWIVDDQIRNIQGAARLGLRTIWMHPEGLPPDGCRGLDDIHDLESALE